MTCQNPKIHTNHTPILDRWEEAFREIRIGRSSCQKYLLIPEKDGVYTRRFILEEGAVFRGAAIALWANMVLKMSVFIEGSDTEASLDLLALAKDGSTLDIAGTGGVALGCERVKLRVDQTYILLGTGARVLGRPTLEVATDSIEWGHSCRIHRISEESLFYLASHGIDASTAEGMLIEAEIGRHVAVMEGEAESIKEEILGKLMV